MNNVIDSIKCWCGELAKFHHISSSIRRDEKVTVWFKCPNGHRTFTEMQSYGSYFSLKRKYEKESKEAKESINGTIQDN